MSPELPQVTTRDGWKATTGRLIQDNPVYELMACRAGNRLIGNHGSS